MYEDQHGNHPQAELIRRMNAESQRAMTQPVSEYTENRPLAVSDAVQKLDHNADLLMERLDMLEKRLSGVLTPYPPSTGGINGNAPQPTRSSMADRLETVNARILIALTNIESVTGRLEF